MHDFTGLNEHLCERVAFSIALQEDFITAPSIVYSDIWSERTTLIIGLYGYLV